MNRIRYLFTQSLDTKEVLKTIPFGKKEIEVESGGLLEEGHKRKDGSSDKIMIAVASITVMVPE